MNIFEETLVIVVESANVAGVYSVNNKAGYVTIDKSDIGLSNVENISIIGVSGYLQDQIDSNTIVGDFVYLTGDQTISGLKTFIERPQVNGTGVLLSGEAAGSANFQYLPVTGNINLLSNNRYSFNTFNKNITGTLPLNPEKGDEIELYDGAGTWSINPLIINNNGNYIEQNKDMLQCNVSNGLIKLIYTTENNIGWRIFPMPIHSVSLILFPSISINGGPTSGIIPLNINLTGINLVDPTQAPVDEWYWNLNTGDENFINGQTINYTYNETGLYNVILSGSNAVGFDIENISINAFLPYIPSVNVTSNKLSGIAPFTGELSGTNTTQPAQFSPVNNWYWDFNSDTIFDATGQNTQVIYTTTGIYTPTAYAVNLGGTGTENITINVIEPFVPIPSVSLSTNEGPVPLTVQFSGNNLADPEFSPVEHWYWDITGDSTPEFDQRVVSYTFNETGIYTFTLTATNSAGSGIVTGVITGLESLPFDGLLVRFNADVGVSEAGGIITSWTDQQNGVVATAFNGPTLLTNEFNGRSAVSFDGSNDYFTFTFPTPINNGTPRTFVIIGRYNNPTTTSQKGYLNSTSSDLCYVFKNSNEDRSYYFSENRQLSGPTAVSSSSLANYHIQTIVHNGISNSNFIRVNGITSYGVSYGVMNNLPQLTNIVIGGRGTPSEIILGQIVEILIYNRELTSQEITQIETYANV